MCPRTRIIRQDVTTAEATKVRSGKSFEYPAQHRGRHGAKTASLLRAHPGVSCGEELYWQVEEPLQTVEGLGNCGLRRPTSLRGEIEETLAPYLHRV